MVQQSPKTPKIVCRAGRQQLMWRYQPPFCCPGSPWRPLTPSSTCWILQPTTPPPATSCTALWFIPLFTRQVSNSFITTKCGGVMYTASLICLLSCFLHCVVIQIGGGGEVGGEYMLRICIAQIEWTVARHLHRFISESDLNYDPICLFHF